MAATAILILTAQHFFQAGTPARSEGLTTAPADALPHEHNTRSDNPPADRRPNWKTTLWRIYERSNDDRLLATAAGVVFFGLLAVFPAVTALVSSYGLFTDPATIGANLQTLALMLPESSFQIVQDQIARVLAKGPPRLAERSCSALPSRSGAPMPASRRSSTRSTSSMRCGKRAASSGSTCCRLR